MVDDDDDDDDDGHIMIDDGGGGHETDMVESNKVLFLWRIMIVATASLCHLKKERGSVANQDFGRFLWRKLWMCL